MGQGERTFRVAVVDARVGLPGGLPAGYQTSYGTQRVFDMACNLAAYGTSHSRPVRLVQRAVGEGVVRCRLETASKSIQHASPLLTTFLLSHSLLSQMMAKWGESSKRASDSGEESPSKVSLS